MPRRQYIADLQQAQNGLLPPGVSNVHAGEDDGQFEFSFSKQTSAGAVTRVVVTALVPDLGEYPKSHDYMIFSGEDAPAEVARALQDIRKTNGKTIFELLDIVATTLQKLSTRTDGDTLMHDSQLDEGEGDDNDDDYDDNDDDVYDSDHEAFTQIAPNTMPNQATEAHSQNTVADRAFRRRLQSDILLAKEAGFKVGVLGQLIHGCNAFMSVSIRMSKLGISEEAMQAWQVDASDYLILILQYPNGYKSNEQLQSFDSFRLEPNIGMRVCVGKNYKPTLQEAIKAFSISKGNNYNGIGDIQVPDTEDLLGESSIKDTFISKPLNGLLKERLIPILRFRALGLPWSGAEQLYIERASIGSRGSDSIDDCLFVEEELSDALPSIMSADHFADPSVSRHSFPLLAMQFLLRHFVRCTEFCLVCHQRMDTDLEAIKPYVCDSELCLYQYMELGFGPSLEHEISAQPYVVDLLISFCYSSAWSCKLRDFPDGLPIVVPPASAGALSSFEVQASPIRHGRPQNEKPQDDATERPPAKVFEIKIDRENNQIEITGADKHEACPVKKGDWVIIEINNSSEKAELHCRVSDTTCHPYKICINPPIVPSKPRDITENGKTFKQVIETVKAPTKSQPATPPRWTSATFQIYNEDFKSLSTTEKCLAICKVLDTLPNVKTLQDYIVKRSSADLKGWVERISPAALSILRWIVASNRACIMQVDDEVSDSSSTRKEERLFGMKDWMQFRFAMGAPDKEQRFINEVRNTTQRLSLSYPTFFAWHGSPLHNWHMIIREGLHFKNIENGRAYGNGVYHAKDAQTSTGYSGRYCGIPGNGGWPNSVLCVSAALALNEIVNAPAEFTSSNPYYVVKQLDWIQTRYLFVQCAPAVEGLKVEVDVKPSKALQQCPGRVPHGISGDVVIPASAIPSRRNIRDDHSRPNSPLNPTPSKKLKTQGGLNNPINIDDDDCESVATDVSDLNILVEEDSQQEMEVVVSQPAKVNAPQTDFIPGSLDFTALPLMPEPEYATSSTTMRLMKELKAVAKVQDPTSPAELGWFIDVEKIDNVYQWIVEMHSFHTFEIKGAKLPLAQEMKKKGITSIVLEIRFNKDFPYTPPYVRVIRPRFLSFAQGGGGHVVLGGAMCMELLTNTGWSSVSSMESVLMQIRLAIASEPFARLDMASTHDYGTGEAADGYVRACRTHGWQVPPGFTEMAYGTTASSYP